MIYTLVLIASISAARTAPGLAVPNIWFYSLDTCSAAGQAWVNAAHASQRVFDASFVCFAAPSTRSAEPPPGGGQ